MLGNKRHHVGNIVGHFDGVEAGIAMLPEVSATVGNKIGVRMDSGVRTGEDVLNQ